MRNILLFVLIISSQCVLAQIESQPISKFNGFDSAKEILLDVRTPQEYKEGSIHGAININWLSNDFDEKVIDHQIAIIRSMTKKDAITSGGIV